MMKRSILFLLPFLFLASCQKDVDPAVRQYLDFCSLDKALSARSRFQIDYESTAYSLSLGKEEENGSLSVRYRGSFVDENSVYSRIVEDFDGTLVSYDQESRLYVTYTEVILSYNEEDGFYHEEMLKEGYPDAALSGEKQRFTKDTRYSPKQALEKKKDVYYQNSSSGLVQGGLYYADFLSSVSQYKAYISIDGDGNCVYELDKVPYVEDSEEGYADERVVCDSLGMLLSLDQELTNTTASTRIKTTLRAFYDDDATMEFQTQDVVG